MKCDPVEHLRKPILIAGPCTIESEQQILKISTEISSMGIKFLRGGAFKPRTSPKTFQGLERPGLEYMRKAADLNGMFVVSEVLESRQLDECYDLIDVIQIGSRSMTAYGFLKYVGEVSSRDKKPVLLKRGMFSTINEMLLAAEYILEKGNPNLLLCLRGIRTFEQIDSVFRFTPDLADILELKDKTELPVIFDPSHSAGNSKYVSQLSRAALGLGADGLIIECHYNPSEALIDGDQCIQHSQLKEIVDSISELS